MRRLLPLLAITGISLSLHGQGVISFNNFGASPEQKVYIDEWLNPSALPPGGTQFLVALYFTPFGNDESSLTQVGDSVGFLSSLPGIFLGGSRTVGGQNFNLLGLFQVKGWEAAYGSTYEEAAANPAARRGESPVFVGRARDPNTSDPTPNLIEASQFTGRPFQGFVIAVPEPSSGILFLAGIAGVFVLHRKLSGRR